MQMYPSDRHWTENAPRQKSIRSTAAMDWEQTPCHRSYIDPAIPKLLFCGLYVKILFAPMKIYTPIISKGASYPQPLPVPTPQMPGLKYPTHLGCRLKVASLVPPRLPDCPFVIFVVINGTCFKPQVKLWCRYLNGITTVSLVSPRSIIPVVFLLPPSWGSAPFPR